MAGGEWREGPEYVAALAAQEAQRQQRKRELSETQALELWASAEICESLGWTRRHLQLAREADFPEPVAVVAAGRIAVWLAADVRRWYGTQPPSREWRRREAVRLFRRGESIAEVARQLGAKRDSIRKWLRDAGELERSEG